MKSLGDDKTLDTVMSPEHPLVSPVFTRTTSDIIVDSARLSALRLY